MVRLGLVPGLRKVERRLDAGLDRRQNVGRQRPESPCEFGSIERDELVAHGNAVPSKPPGAVRDRNRRRAVSLYRRPGEQVLHARDRKPGPSGGLLQVSRPGARFGERLRRGIVSSPR